MTTPSLIRTICEDKTQKIKLTNYADMVVFDKDKTLIAIRFGGYPETVQAMTDAIMQGCNLELNDPNTGKITVSSKGKRNFVRKVSHDGVYAESITYLKDDDLHSLSLGNDEKSDEETIKANRDLYIFCDNDNELFTELDRKLAVPLIPAYKDYFIEELKSRNILNSLTVRTFGRQFSGWHLNVTEDEKEIVQVLEDGLKKGVIKIPGSVNRMEGVFAQIGSFTGYLKEFGVQIANRIKKSFLPLFNPAEEQVSDPVNRVNQFIIDHAGYSLFDAQLGATEALKRQLENSKLALLVAECGTGKTKIGSAALYAYQHGKKDKSFNVVVCPCHVADKWVRELHETLPDCYAQVVTSITDVNMLYEIYQKDHKSIYCILSKETARNGYMRQPAVLWNPVQKGFTCPHCDAVQEMSVFDDGTKYIVNADQFFFKNENSANHKCQKCEAPLWGAVNPDVLDPKKHKWIRIGEYGYVYRNFAYRHLDVCKDKKARNKIIEIADNPEGIYPTVGAYRRFPLATYIKRHIRHLDALICDELHEYSGESAQGEAMADLAGIADKVIGMTATLVNGYSKGMFYLLFRLKPFLMLLDRQRYGSSRDFCEQYGVVENVYNIDCDNYNASSKNKKRKVREKFLPGISPIVYSRFLLENAVFLSLSDMGKELPDYEEIPIPCQMCEEVGTQYRYLETELKRIMREYKKIGNRILSVYLNLLSAYPDQPYGHDPVLNPFTKEELVVPKSIGNIDMIHPKDESVLGLVERKVKTGERVIIYTAWTRLDTRKKLHKLLTEKGYRVSILDTKVKPRKREKWVDDRVREGIDVLIVNPALVQTGIDLNAFTTLVFYNVAYNLYIFRQASRRSWRINQTAPKIEIYMYYYEQTMQQRALRLMASKLAAATVIEGNISEEGLAAMSDCQDLTTQLAKELMLGIKDDVDDLAANFKKMAIINNRESRSGQKTEVKPPPEQVQPVAVTVLPESIPQIVPAGTLNPISVVSPDTEKQKNKSRKKAINDFASTGQLNLFDLLAS